MKKPSLRGVPKKRGCEHVKQIYGEQLSNKLWCNYIKITFQHGFSFLILCLLVTPLDHCFQWKHFRRYSKLNSNISIIFKFYFGKHVLDFMRAILFFLWVRPRKESTKHLQSNIFESVSLLLLFAKFWFWVIALTALFTLFNDSQSWTSMVSSLFLLILFLAWHVLVALLILIVLHEFIVIWGSPISMN